MPCVNFWAKKAQNSNPHWRHSPVNTISIKLHLSRILIEPSIQLSANTKNRKKEINLKLCQANKERRATKGYKATVMVTRIGSRTLPDAWLYNAKTWKQYNAKTWKQPSIMTSKVLRYFLAHDSTCGVIGIGLGGVRMRNCGYASIQGARHKNRGLWLKYNGFTGSWT